MNMTELPPKTDVQILVNGEQQDKQQDEVVAEEQTSSSSLDDGCSVDSINEDKEALAKMQSVFHQVRKQIRTQVGMKAPKSSILELVQKVWEKELEAEQMSGDCEVGNGSGEEEKQEEKLKEEADRKEEENDIFVQQLEACKKVLRGEFEDQITQLRKEMQAYTDQAIKDLESEMKNLKCQHQQQAGSKEQQQHGLDKKPRSSVASSLAARRGRVLTRTMTTIIPKTCASIIIGPRAKSETVSSSQRESSRPLMRDPVLTSTGNRFQQSRKPLPPTCPPLHQTKRPVRAKTRTGN